MLLSNGKSRDLPWAELTKIKVDLVQKVMIKQITTVFVNYMHLISLQVSFR